ncbi:MAG: DUF5946 family protein [Pelagimonas sp.]|uniref:DUF5946 family protein n=1 Tax=Pelagimonas sp. TaxID=2073170 RepID=UPI003D6C2FDE
MNVQKSACVGCGAVLPDMDGPTHSYMLSSSACFHAFTTILALEYSDTALLPTHRLTVDCFAVQHGGVDQHRAQVNSTRLHLARLYLQLGRQMQPKETNDVMLGLGRFKHSLRCLEPPSSYQMTVSDVVPHAGGAEHLAKIREWARVTWADWSAHHAYISDWAERHLAK